MDKEQLIQDYVVNRLSPADKETVEKLLETDASFKEAFTSHKNVVMAYKLSEAENLKTTFQKLEQENAKKQTKTFRIPKIWYSAIAAVLLIGFFYITNTSTTGDDLFNSHFKVYPNTYLPVTREANETELLKAFVAYENEDFKNAALQFEEILKISNNPNIRFYYAMTLMNSSKLDRALEQLVLLNGNTFEYQAETLWYTSLIYLQKEDFKNAAKQLHDLKRLNATFKSKERERILDKLKE